MSHANPMAAKLLSVSSNAFAAYATKRLFDAHPEIKDQFGSTSFEHWKSYFAQRLKELAAAVEENEPALFVSQIRWERSAFVARKVSEEFLVAALHALQNTLDHELPDEHKSLAISCLQSAITVFEQMHEEPSFESKDPLYQLAAKYLLMVLDGDSQAAIDLILKEREQGLSLEETYLTLMRAQSEIGRMWHKGEVSIAEEHLITNTTRRAMSVLAHFAERDEPNGLTVVSCAVAGNQHDIGVRAVSDFFEFAGWRAVCTGSDNPPNEIAHAIICFDASLALISAAQATHLHSTRETINLIREKCPECKIMLGGEAFRDSPERWKQFGVDGYATSPTQAVQIAASLCLS